MDRSAAKGQDHYYAVLNLNKGASLTEVNERYRSLSLIFHPDKHHDDPLKKEVATKEFLEIQKAYQVLSDPFSRQVYDELGPEAVNWSWPPDLRLKSKEDIAEALQNGFVKYQKHKAQNDPNKARTATSCTISADSLSRPGSIVQKMSGVTVVSRNIQLETPQISLGKQTSISFEGQTGLVGVRSNNGGINTQGTFGINGTVRHQVSPRISSQLSVGLLFPHVMKANLNYEDPDNGVQLNMIWIPLVQRSFPPTTISLTRKLFKKKPYRAKIDIQAAPQPSMALHFIWPSVSNISPGESSQAKGPRLRSESGLSRYAMGHSVGIAFDAFIPKLVGESVITFIELSARVKSNAMWGFTGPAVSVGVEWFSDGIEIASNIVLNATAIVLDLNLTYMDQRISVPIVLSSEPSPRFALGAVVIPSLLTLVGYRFILLPYQRRRRSEYLRQAHRMLEEDSDLKRERAAVDALLKDRVKRIVKTESDKQGLIIQEATYGMEGTDEYSSKLAIDVQGPLQVLVRNSQLHISSGMSKSALQGFIDPAPFASKVLRIRYTFGGAPHYAEFFDGSSVVLPLAASTLENRQMSRLLKILGLPLIEFKYARFDQRKVYRQNNSKKDTDDAVTSYQVLPLVIEVLCTCELLSAST